MFLKNILLGTVKSVPAKLCAAFLCTLLNRLRFSPQNVEFGTKRREIRPLRRGTPSVCSRWSASSPSPSRLTPCHLSQRERLWRNRTLCSSTGNYTAMPRALPLGELSPKVTERARALPAARLFPQETSAAAAVCLYDPSREKGVQKRPQAFLYPKI